MAYQLFKLPKNTQIDSSVRITPGAKAWFYETLTSNLQDTFTTSALNVAHANPVVADANGVFPPIYLDPTLIYKLTLTTSADVLIYTVDPVNDQVLSAALIGQYLYPITTAEVSAGVTPTDFRWKAGEAPRYGADFTGVVDATAAFNTALSCNTVVYGLGYPYLINGSVTVNSNQCLLGGGSVLTRVTGTAPMLYVLGVSSAADGLYLITPNASASGVVVLGHPDATSDTDARFWRFTNSTISGRVNQANDILIYVPSGQAAHPARSNYFGIIQNVNLYGGDHQLFFDDLANAHNVSNLQFWNGRTNCIRMRGAGENSFNNLFFHTGAANGLTSINLQDATSGINHSSFNCFIGWTSETTGAADVSLRIDTNCAFNNILGNSNVAGGWFINNSNNWVVLNSALQSSTGLITTGNVTAVDTALSGKLTVGLAIQPSVAATTGITSGAGAAAGAAVTIIPSTALAVSKATLVLVNIVNTSTNGNLGRSDMVLLQLRNSGHSASTVTVVSSSITSTGTAGEPVTATYTLSFADGAGLPKLQVSIASVTGPQTFTAEATLIRV